MTDTPSYEDARVVATTVRDLFVSEAVDQVILAYQEFVSMGTQRVAVRSSCPLNQCKLWQPKERDADSRAFEFEPSLRREFYQLSFPDTLNLAFTQRSLMPQRPNMQTGNEQ